MDQVFESPIQNVAEAHRWRRLLVGAAAALGSLTMASCEANTTPSDHPRVQLSDVPPTPGTETANRYVNVDPAEISLETAQKVAENTAYIKINFSSATVPNLTFTEKCSGFIISQNQINYAVTARHCFPTSFKAVDGKTYDLSSDEAQSDFSPTIIDTQGRQYASPSRRTYKANKDTEDVALLRLEGAGGNTGLMIGASTALKPGDTVIQVGYPASSTEPVLRRNVFLGLNSDGLNFLVNDVESGVCTAGSSGGVITNAQGEAVAVVRGVIAGKDAYQHRAKEFRIAPDRIDSFSAICVGTPIEIATGLLPK